MFWALLLLTLTLAPLVHSQSPSHRARVLDRRRVPSAAPSTAPAAYNTKSPTPLRPPADAHGPLALLPLAGRCFSVQQERYEYTICPFFNVTQRDVPSSWNSFWGLLGLWEGWAPPGGGALRGEYSDGTDCGAVKRRTVVTHACSTGGAYVLKGVAEPRTCEYAMTLASPEACGVDPAAPLPSRPPLPSALPPTASAAPAELPVVALALPPAAQAGPAPALPSPPPPAGGAAPGAGDAVLAQALAVLRSAEAVLAKVDAALERCGCSGVGAADCGGGRFTDMGGASIVLSGGPAAPGDAPPALAPPAAPALPAPDSSKIVAVPKKRAV
jgi:hypothetical protein